MALWIRAQTVREQTASGLRRLTVAFLVVTPLSGQASAADTLRIAVASNFQTTARLLADDFVDHSGLTAKVRIATGSTGQLYAQILQGAPFDAFLSADRDRPAKLIDAGRAVAASRITYAIGRLVLLRRASVSFPSTPAAWADDRYTIAIANPAIAPYGIAAKQALDHLAGTTPRNAQLRLGSNVAQAYQFIVTGNVDFAIVSEGQLRLDRGRAAEVGARSDGVCAGPRDRGLDCRPIPASAHAPVRQDAVVLTGGRAPVMARRFVDYLKSERALKIIMAQGYDIPSSR